MTEQVRNPGEMDASTAPAKNWREEMRHLLVLGAPMAATQLIQMLTFTVDVMMIGRLGPAELAASSLGIVFFWGMWMIGFGPVMAVSPLVSQALGADRNARDDVRHSFRMALWVLACLMPVTLIIAFQAEHIALALGQPAEASAKAQAYLLTLMPGWYFSLVIMVMRNFLAALGKTMVPLFLVAGATLLNIAFNWVLIFGNLGFPALGLPGAGIASSLATAISFGAFFLYCHFDRQAGQFAVFRNLLKPDWPRFREVIRLGWPISLTTVFEGMLFNAAVFLMGLIGLAEVAAYHVALNVAAMAFMLPFGFSMAGAVRIGLAAGAKDRQGVQRAAVVTLTTCLALMSLFAIGVALFPEAITSLYLSGEELANEEVRRLVLTFLPVAAAFMLFDAAQVTANQLLRGLKDVRFAMVASGVSYWLIGFSLAWYFGLRTSFGALGIWYGLAASLAVAALTLGARLWWMTTRRAPFADSQTP